MAQKRKGLVSLVIVSFFAVVLGRRIAPQQGGFVPGGDYTPTPEVVKNATVAPLNYTLLFRPILDEAPGFTLNTAQVILKVRVKALESSKEINLQHKNLRLNLDGVKISTLEGGQLPIESQKDEQKKRNPSIFDDHPPLPQPSEYVITLKEAFNPGDILEIEIPYEVKLTEALHHSSYSILLESVLGFDSYKDLNESGKFAVSTLEYYGTQQVIPLFKFDNGGVKTPFKIVIARLDGKYQSLSNMERESTEADSEHPGWVLDHFKETIPLQPHQVFMLVHQLSNNTIPAGNQTVSFWATKSYLENHQSVVTYATEVASQLLQYYSDVFQMPFPSGKLDILRLPTQSTYNAENFGIALLNGGRNALTEEEPGNNQVAIKLTEEVARQWIGTILTQGCTHCQYSTHLQEDLFTYVKHLGVQKVIPGYPLEDQFEIGSPILGPGRSRTRLQMMEEIFGEDVMTLALAKLVQRAKFTQASEEALFESIDEAILERNKTHLLPSPEIKMKDILPDWFTYRPEIIVKMGRSGDVLTFSHEGYDYYAPNDTEIQKAAYWTPIIIKGQNGTDTLWLQNDSNATVTHELSESLKKSDYLLINPNGIAPYRTRYDMNLTLALAAQLEKDHTVFGTAGRIKLIEDQMTLSNNGKLSIEQALEMTRYLEKEENNAVWRSVLDKLVNPLLDRMIDDEEAFGRLQKYFAPKLDSLVKRIGWDQVKNWYPLEKTCLNLKVPACIEKAQSQIENWKMHQDLKPVDAFSRGPIPPSENICAAVSEAKDASTWGFVLNKFLTYNDSDTYGRFVLVEGLACSRNTTLVSNLLDQSVTMHEGTQSDIYSSFARHSTVAIKKILYEFLKTNVVSGKISPETFAKAITQLQFSKRTDPNLGADLREFINKNRELLSLNENNLNGVAAQLEGHLENFSTCVSCEWWDTVGNDANKWLANQK